MVPNKSLDESEIIAALLHDVSNAHGLVFNTRSCRLTLKQVSKRIRTEGKGFLAKTLPRLGKAFDKALAGDAPLNATKLGFASLPNSELPRFLGEFFSRVLRPDGALLQHPCDISVKAVRQILYPFYKYELPYTNEQEQQVIQKFKQTEEDLSTRSDFFKSLEADLERSYRHRHISYKTRTVVEIARVAKRLLSDLFATFDPRDIYPKHGPGAVATRQKLWDKYLWRNVSSRITDIYPFDAYFCASLGHVCDSYPAHMSVTQEDLPARVVLVPKDSRGPRLISCEPVDFQWVQQGLGRAIVELVERHPLTRERVNFTDQSLNQFYALVSSRYGRYATLDLNEASDRVSADLVRLLFPEHVFTYLWGCRSSSTELPDGSILPLLKFAPMGSCLCFPVLALTVWALLSAGLPDAHASNDVIVYGDDVIVPTAQAVDAMSILESFGLKVNRDKSCISGLFRESCGTDAFNGINVTPVRFRTVWSSTPSPDSYCSWIAYANSLYDKKYYCTYDLIVERLLNVYGAIPSKDMHLTCPSLQEVPETKKPKVRRFNKSLQKLEWRVWDLKSPSINKTIDGWSMLLRYFAESVGRPINVSERQNSQSLDRLPMQWSDGNLGKFDSIVLQPFLVSRYTNRRAGMLVRRWR
jgi:hypothetical protein